MIIILSISDLLTSGKEFRIRNTFSLIFDTGCHMADKKLPEIPAC
jgi:hypothetical protein